MRLVGTFAARISVIPTRKHVGDSTPRNDSEPPRHSRHSGEIASM